MSTPPPWLSLLAIALLVGCSSNGSHASWSYSGATGPEHWGDLSSDFEAAKNGQEQSPIDIDQVVSGRDPLLEWNYETVPLTVVDTGHSVQVNYPEGSWIRLGDDEFQLRHVHFRCPSEHRVAGRQFPMECHLVHQSEDGRLAVIGILFESGPVNGFLADIVPHLPTAPGPAQTIPGTQIQLGDLLPESRARYTYPGSLTTPPCSEGVSWVVLKEPVFASPAQLDALRAVHEGNARPIQPLNDRTVRLVR